MLLKQKSSESQLKSVPVLTLWTKKLDFVPKIIKKRLQDLYFVLTLTDGIFETGAYGVPNKSQNPTILGQGGASSTQCPRLSEKDCYYLQAQTDMPFHYLKLVV